MPSRRDTREVRIGNVTIGGGHPIAVQSMTVSDTNDVAASVNEVIRLAGAGADIVRLTVPSVKAAESMARIRSDLRERGCPVPLVADIHYTPNAAHLVARTVEKVRINPGNFADRPGRTMGEDSFDKGAARAAETFGRLVEELKSARTALRIGVNHGSLSERMTGRYGDSPEGMVESALEYVEVCERLDYRDVVVSLKSSIPAVMTAAYRLFAERADRAGWNIPLHIGVTEAGMGEEGLLRSACGIGTLLMEGIGDTIRVSLTGDPVQEVPAAREILKVAGRLRSARAGTGTPPAPVERVVAPLAVGPVGLGGMAPLAVLAAPSRRADAAGAATGGGASAEGEPDLVLLRRASEIAPWRAAGRGTVLWAGGPGEIPALAGSGADAVAFDFPAGGGDGWREADEALARARQLPVIRLTGPARPGEVEGGLDDLLRAMPGATAGGAVIGAGEGSPLDMAPALESALRARNLGWVQMISWDGAARTLPALTALSPPLLAGTAGLLFPRPGAGGETGVATAWHVLQATRRRITHVEYISCPSCGRTLFDLEEVTTRVRKRTLHLKDVKIAVMGCIVNGPGEMADADFGYVGSGPGKIDLYVGRERVTRNIPEAESIDRLVELIREKGAWTEPEGAV